MPFSSFRKPKNSLVNKRRSSSPFSSSEYDSDQSNSLGHSNGSAHSSKPEIFGKRGSTDSSVTTTSSYKSDASLTPKKSNYRILFLGACRTGKTSIIRQFLYDNFNPSYRETMDDMYRGEFEFHGQKVNFDIQDVSGNYVYEFPGMRNVSLSSADAFVIVFSLDDHDSWEEVDRLRDMVHEAKDESAPIVVVGNKSDVSPDVKIPCDSLEAIVTFDWENGYVECSAKNRFNVDKIFKELLQQAKSTFDFTPSHSSDRNNPSTVLPINYHFKQSVMAEEDHFKRRQSLPLVPSGMKGLDADSHKGSFSPLTERRRSSLAAIRRESCKVS